MKKYLPNIFVSLICFLFVLSPVSAEERPSLYWFDEDTTNLLNSIQQDYVCDNWDFVNSFDTIAYYTDSSALVFGNYSYYKNGSSAPYRFDNLYWLNADGSFSRENENDSGLGDPNNVGAVYKSNGAFDLNVDNVSVLNVCQVISSPSVDLPQPNELPIVNNVEQSNYINSISSPATQGAIINYFRYDYFNIYAVHSTAINQEIGYGQEDLLIKYKQDETGRYLIPVYDHSEVVVYGPNMSVSSSGFQITPSLYSGVTYSFPNSTGIIQRDIQKFEFKMVDLYMENLYGYNRLPFSNSNINTGKVEYLGQQFSVRGVGTGSRSFNLTIRGENHSTDYFFVCTDSYKDIEQAKYEETRIQINNNISNNFTELDNTLQHGNALTQGSKNDLDIMDSQFNSSYDRYQSIEQGLIEDYNNNLDDIDLDTYKITNNLDLINTANFVRTQFDRLTLNNPFGLVLGFSLCVGLALLLIGKRL